MQYVSGYMVFFRIYLKYMFLYVTDFVLLLYSLHNENSAKFHAFCFHFPTLCNFNIGIYIVAYFYGLKFLKKTFRELCLGIQRKIRDQFHKRNLKESIVFCK